MADEKHPLSEDIPPPYAPRQPSAPGPANPYGPAYPPPGQVPHAYGPVPQGPPPQPYGAVPMQPGPQYGASAYPPPGPMMSSGPPPPQHAGAIPTHTAPTVVVHVAPAPGTSAQGQLMTPQPMPISQAIQASRQFDRDYTFKHIVMSIGIAIMIIACLFLHNILFSEVPSMETGCKANETLYNLTIYQNSP